MTSHEHIEESLHDLQRQIDQLRKTWEEARQYQQNDPSSALVKARVAAEMICKRLYLEQRRRDPENKTWSQDVAGKMLGELTPKLHKEKVVPRVVSTALFTIQHFGNMGAHDVGDEADSIESHLIEPCLSALTCVVQWFLETQCDERLNVQFDGAQRRGVSDIAQEQELFSQVEEVANGLEQILQASIHQIRAMQITAENFFLRRLHSPGPHPLREELGFSRKRDLFHLDNGDEVDGFEIKTLGNLTGPGNLEEKEEAFWAEIDMALDLTTQFQITRAVLPKVVWVYYTSAQGFIYIAPWTSHKNVDHSYSPTLLTLEFFTKGRFEENPERGLFWTKPYCDEYGEGMMVTLGAPIDNDGNFLGTVAVDLSVDLFNEHLRHQDLRGGELVLVNEHFQVLGHPYRTSSDDKEVHSLAEVTGVDAFDGTELDGWEPRTVGTVAGRDAFFVAVENSPWRLFFVSAP
jgi:hypothetical protein